MKTFVPKEKVLITVIFFLSFFTSFAQSVQLPSGAFIVNMGVTPQTYGNGIKPWGMIHDLIRNYRVQVKWVISQSKGKDGIDFSYNGTDFKGGTFIIPARYRTAAINDRIAYWQTQGVVGVTTTSALTVNVTYNLKYSPRWTFDFQNGNIALGFLQSAGIPSNEYPKKYPSELSICDDIFVMPHADPTWAEHSNLLYWNQNNRGWIWAGCHAVSVLENLVNPSNAAEKMNFLSQTGLVPFGSHSDGTPPYNYRFPTEPEMQFMGTTEAAQQNGSEQIFLPQTNTWRTSTKVAVYSPTQQNVPSLSPGEAAAIVYGRAFGDTARGKVMYQGGHNIDKGNADAVAAMRAFFNFSYMSVYDKVVTPTLVGPISLVSLNSYSYKAVLPVGNLSSDFTYYWTSSCGGSFSDPFDTATVFTAPMIIGCDPCILTCTITDGCGREFYQELDISVCSSTPPVALDRLTPVITNPDGTGPQPIGDAVPLAGTDEDGYVVSYILKSLPNNGVLFYDHDNNPATADTAIYSLPSGELVLTAQKMKTLKFDPADGFGGNASFLYTVADNSGLRDLTPATFTIPVNPPPAAITKICTPVASNAGKTIACNMEATDNGTIVSYTITALPAASQCIVYINNANAYVGQILTPLQATQITYKPSGTYIGYAEIMYTATDNNGAIDLTPATLTLQMVNQPPTANDISSTPIANPVGPIMFALPALSATDNDGAVASYIITAIPAPAQGLLYYNNFGTNYSLATNNLGITLAQAANLKFDPADDFSGSASLQYSAKDDRGLVDNNPAKLYIPVQQVPPVAKDTTNPSNYAGGGWKPIYSLSASNPGYTIISYKILTVPDAVNEGKIGYGTANTVITAGMTLTPAQAATMKFDPKKPFNGVTSFTYTCTNNIGLTDLSPAIVKLPVHNNPPAANNITNAAIANTAGQTTIAALTATDPDEMPMNGHSFTITSLPKASAGILFLGANPVVPGQLITVAQSSTLKFDPVPNKRDTAVFTYTVTDECGMAGLTPATFKIPITGVLTAPVTANISMPSVSVRQVSTPVPSLSATDADGYIDYFYIQAIQGNLVGSLYLDGNQLSNGSQIPYEKRSQLYFIPFGTQDGTGTFKYRSVDNDGLISNNANVDITVVNSAPVAYNISMQAVRKNTIVAIIPLNATDSDGVISSYTVTSLPTLANVLQCDLLGNNVYSNVAIGQILTPAQAGRLRINFNNNLGTSTFTYSAKDNTLAISNVATYTIPVTSSTANQFPVANNVTSASLAMNAPQGLINPLSAIDIDGTITSYNIVKIPPSYYGMLYYNSTGAIYDSILIGNKTITAAQAATLKFRPSGVYAGNITFTYYATDNSNASSTMAVYTIPVGCPEPVATDLVNGSVSSNSGPFSLLPLAATSLINIDGFYITDLPLKSQGILVMDGSPVTTGQRIRSIYANRLEFDPEPSFTGTASFKYTAVDNSGAFDKTPAIVTITVTNSAPFADEKINQVITNTNGTPAQAIPALSGYDNDGAIVSYTIKSLPTNGVLYVNGAAATLNQVLTPAQAALLSFDPVDNFNSSTSFTYNVKDNSNNFSAIAIYKIVANVPPTTNNIISSPFSSLTPRTAISALVGWDDVSVAFYSILTLPNAAAGKLFLNNVEVTSLSQVNNLSAAEISQFSFLPASSFAGAIFTYTATDNLGIIDVTPAVYIIPQSSAGGNNPLPIYLLSFTGKAVASENQLNWSTSQEINSKQIEIERSSNGTGFTKIGSVLAQGFSNSRTDYAFTDNNVKGGTMFYRLKLVDADGQSRYSDIIVIKRDTRALTISRVMPNPFNDKVDIELIAENSNLSVLSLYDMGGSIVKTMSVKTKKGVNLVQLTELGALGSGSYILRIKNDDGEVNTRLVKINN
jgi:hypothetical protein